VAVIVQWRFGTLVFRKATAVHVKALGAVCMNYRRYYRVRSFFFIGICRLGIRVHPLYPLHGGGFVCKFACLL
jgi:hypothetical protein